MAITIPKNFAAQFMRSGNEATTENPSDVTFHRHCQRTICSAHGHDGQDCSTWNAINGLYSPTDLLPSLSSCLGESETWISYFQGNDDNITQDLAAILKLVDKVAAKSVSSSATIDYNLVPVNSALLESYGDNNDLYTEPAVIDGSHYVFKVEQNGGRCRPRAFLAEKYINSTDMVQWEFHVKNLSSSRSITVEEPYVLFRGQETYDVMWLTDQKVVAPETTNIYVLRADVAEETVTVSLAHQGVAEDDNTQPVNPSWQDFDFKTLTFTMGGNEIGSVDVLMENDQTIQIPVQQAPSTQNEVEKKTLTFQVNGEEVDSVDVVMDEDKTINIPVQDVTSMDQNSNVQTTQVVQVENNVENNYTTIHVEPETRTYKVQTDSDFPFVVDLSEYANRDSDMVSFDLHVQNTGNSQIRVYVDSVVQSRDVNEQFTISPSCIISTVVPINYTSVIEYLADLGSKFIACREKWRYEVELKDTIVRYRKASELSNLEISIVGSIEGYIVEDADGVLVGHYTDQIPNVDQAEEILIGKDVTTIGDNAFRNCTYLSRVIFPENLTGNIGRSAFYCTALAGDLNVPPGTTGISEFAFMSTNVRSVVLPDSVASVRQNSFSYCGSLQKIEFGSGLTSIDNYAFQSSQCKIFDFRKVTSVPELGGVYAFAATPPARKIIVPDALFDSWISTTNWSSLLYNIKYSIIKASKYSIVPLTPTIVKYSQASGLPDWEDDIAWTSIEGSGLSSPYCTLQIPEVQQAERIQIGENITGIGYRALHQCQALKRLEMPDTVTSIGNQAFYECSELISVVMSPNLTSIGEKAFLGCTKLENISIPSGVTAIEGMTFQNCSGLERVVFGGTITSIGGGAFRNCGNCTVFDFRNAMSIPSLASTDAFTGTAVNKVIIVPDNLYDSWRNAANWSSTSPNIKGSIMKLSQYLSDSEPTTVRYTQASGLQDAEILISGTIEGISSSPYYTTQIPNVDNAEEIVLGEDVTTIGRNAFRGCSNLRSITFPNGFDGEIYQYAFYNCTGLTDISLPDNVTNIQDSAFRGCTSITEVVIPDAVTSLGPSAFRDCTGLTSISLGNGLSSIEYSTFYGCNGLTSVTIPDSVTSIGNQAFYYCSNITRITFGSGLTHIGYNAFLRFSNCEVFDFSNVTSVPELDGPNAFSNGMSDKRIVVPDELYDEWIAARNWSNSSISANVVRAGDYFPSEANPTYVRYTQASGLSDWSKVILETISGSSGSTAPTPQIPNVTDAEEINVGYGVPKLDSYAFYNCPNLTKVTTSETVTYISGHVFQNCSGLTSITFHGDLTYIGADAFRGCSNCAIYDFRRATIVPYLSSTYVFSQTLSNKEIIVPDALYNEWIQTGFWSNFRQNIVKASQSSLGSLDT